jgi:hypothetical protein
MKGPGSHQLVGNENLKTLMAVLDGQTIPVEQHAFDAFLAD